MNALINLKECKEYMTIVLNGREHNIKLTGTIDAPYFCGKDVCEVLGYKDLKDALKKHVDIDDKSPLQQLQQVKGAAPFTEKKLEGAVPSNLYIGKKYDSLSYHDGKAVYISEGGLRVFSNEGFVKFRWA